MMRDGERLLKKKNKLHIDITNSVFAKLKNTSKKYGYNYVYGIFSHPSALL